MAGALLVAAPPAEAILRYLTLAGEATLSTI